MTVTERFTSFDPRSPSLMYYFLKSSRIATIS